MKQNAYSLVVLGATNNLILPTVISVKNPRYSVVLRVCESTCDIFVDNAL